VTNPPLQYITTNPHHGGATVSKLLNAFVKKTEQLCRHHLYDMLYLEYVSPVAPHNLKEEKNSNGLGIE
jgi:hypothetical protein